MVMGVGVGKGIVQQTPTQFSWKGGSSRLFLRRPRRVGIPNERVKAQLITADLGIDMFLPALGMKPEAAVLMSALLATTSVAMNFFSGISLESKKAELAIELEREKQFQQQLRELQGVIARYRGPLLESAIDLEQRLWHLVSDQCFDVDEMHAKLEVRYFTFCVAQFLGFVEVVRREGPRENSFLQRGNPQGSDTLFVMVEAIRFVLCASPTYLESWYVQGPNRNHPGARMRQSREEIILSHKQRSEIGCPIFPEKPLLRISRGHQRAIGTYMITTKMGAERHYTMSYGDFHKKLEMDESFRYWFAEIEEDICELTKQEPWMGETAFPLNKWSRVLLFQQLLVELMDLLDPDCVRLPLDRRRKLMPTNYGQLPNVLEYQRRLIEFSGSGTKSGHSSALEGLKDLMSTQINTDTEKPLAYPLNSMEDLKESDEEFEERHATSSSSLR
ncbi:hypothetical protein PSENEW3n2_00005212 [Picochlorum sp. SENEW3]|nr:hypothetical protein PSENEW3n2_00005212 [Picochlorum sp. SENEW3]WPT17207.1 hypothetical protein PSENEW3_00005212 [Picochlorum sp. SENEW3]